MSYSADLLKKIVSKVVKAAEGDAEMLAEPMPIPEALEPMPEAPAPAPVPEAAETASHEEQALERDLGVLASELESMGAEYAASRPIVLRYESILKQMQSMQKKLDKLRRTKLAPMSPVASIEAEMIRTASLEDAAKMPEGTTGVDLF